MIRGRGRQGTEGFTLTEIMIVVAVIGLLAAIGIPSFQKARQNTQRNTCLNNQRLISDMLHLYCMENNCPGTTIDFPHLCSIRTALSSPYVPVGERYIKDWNVFVCPGRVDSQEHDYSRIIENGCVVGVRCSIFTEHNIEE